MKFTNEELEVISCCPWCHGNHIVKLFPYEYGNVCKCECGMVFADKILSEKGLRKYWCNYESQIHKGDKKLSAQRQKMYEQDYAFVSKFISGSMKDVLDIGCSNGAFLRIFKKNGFYCEGVEYGEEAKNKASGDFKVYYGTFPEIPISKKYDVITFRGVIQYLKNPKPYFKKAMELLKEGGLIFITASPNSESICFSLFKNMHNLPVKETDYYMYSEKLLTDFFEENGMCLIGEKMTYLGTPYENYREDIKKVAHALQLAEKGEIIDFKSPAFFDNMLTLVYKRV